MNDYDNKSCNALQKPFYRPVEVAIRWCGLIKEESKILSALDTNDMIPKTGQFPLWPCLQANTEKIFDAIMHNELPHGRDGKTVSNDDHVAKQRLTVRHNDLKIWMSQYYPDQKPEFLFDETERKTHSAINADSFRALLADRDALQTQLTGVTAELREVTEERDKLKIISSSLSDQISERERQTVLKLIIGMAIKGYCFDPAASRNSAASEIVSDLALLGISIDDDTVRKWLKEAAALLPSQRQDS